jgi:predicted enzyme related to lactoylglutathione lyase
MLQLGESPEVPMHKSRLTTVLIDCAEEDWQSGLNFWSSALGKPVVEDDDEKYKSLRGRVGGQGGPYVLLQKVPAAERAFHLDIETDDVEAEVARLQKLGATLKARISRHVVMTAPTGHAFCVVPQHRGDFEDTANRWED